MQILITGGCGYVGTKLTEAVLAHTNFDVVVVDTQWFGNYLPRHERLTVCETDVRSLDDLDLSGCDTIFHLAGIANDPSVELNPALSWHVNVLATMRLADRAARHGVRQFVFPSSGAVYGVREEPDVTEDLDLVPISEYNRTKMVAERVLLSYGTAMTVTIFRPATICGYSRRMRLDLAVNLLTMQALTKGRMTVFGGAQVRPNIHIDDMIDLYLFALDRRLAGIYNAAFENLSIMDLATLVADQVPADITIQGSDDPRSYRLSSDRLLAAGFAPKKNVRIAIGELAEAYRDGRLTDEPQWRNVNWMKAHNFG